MTALAYIKHECPGRLRVGFPDHTRDDDFFHRIEAHFRETYPAIRVRSNPITGTVLLAVDQDSNVYEILETAKARGLLQLIDTKLLRREPAADLAWTLKSLARFGDRVVRDLTSNLFDMKTVLGFSLFGLGVYQARQGKLLPAGLTLAVNAIAFLEIQKTIEKNKL
jgi:hypothetical protein